MSRCFPFPPPGYERKARNEEEDLLEKEKHREKKNKKEKKEKEKREGKEKREKDRSDGKHREKKDKKEKQKDKDKKRDKEKDGEKAKEKSKASDEKRLSGQAEFHGGHKLIQKDGKEKDNSVDKKISGGEKRLTEQTEFHGGEKLFQKEGKDKGNSVDKKFSGQIRVNKTEKLTQNNNLCDESKFVQELARRIKDDTTGAGNQFEIFSGAERKKDEGMVRLVSKGTSTLAAGKEDRRAEDKTTEWQGTRDGSRAVGNAIVQTKFEALPRPLDKNVDRKMEGNEKAKDKESDDKRGVKSKEKDKEKKSHGKDKDRDREKKKEDKQKRKEDRQKKKEDKQKKKEEKEKKKEEKAKEKIQLKNSELDKLSGSNKNDIIDNHAIKNPQLPKDISNTVPTGGNMKKRKDFETNGVTYAHDILPSKLPRPASSSHPLKENGRILEPCQTFVLEGSDKKGASNNLKMDNHKEHKINGVIEVQALSTTPMKLKPATAVASPMKLKPETAVASHMKLKPETAAADPIAEASARPPHPDSKYLSQIYSVPNMEEWSDYNDEEWLFSADAPQPKKHKVESSLDEETPHVWAEAQQIESADICALPYVIPY